MDWVIGGPGEGESEIKSQQLICPLPFVQIIYITWSKDELTGNDTFTGCYKGFSAG